MVEYSITSKETKKLSEFHQISKLLDSRPLARFIHTVCMRRIRGSCEGLTSVHNKYTGYLLKHLLLRHMDNLPLPVLMCYALKPYALRLPTATADGLLMLLSHCTVRCFIYCLCRRWYNSILGPFSPPLAGESFDTCSKAVKLILVDTQVF